MNWVLHYIREKSPHGVDIFNSDFVDAYIANCKPKKVSTQLFGANKVPELGRLLSEMYYSNMLNRSIIGLTGCYSGFPKWCYVYDIKIYS